MSKPTKAPLPRWGGLLTDTTQPGDPLEGARRLPLDLVDPNPWQPRQHTDADRLQELADDVRARGILQPLIVRRLGDRYQVVAGGRRYAAAIAAGLTEVPALIVDWDDKTAREASIRENVHREDMDPEDEGNYYRALQDQGLSLRDIAADIGKSYQYVNRRIKLVSDPALLRAYREGLIGLRETIEREPDGGIVVAMEDAPAFAQPPTPPAGVTQSNNIADSPRSLRRPDSVFRPFQAFHNTLQRLDPTTVTPEVRGDLAATIDTLIEELQAIKAELGE